MRFYSVLLCTLLYIWVAPYSLTAYRVRFDADEAIRKRSLATTASTLPDFTLPEQTTNLVEKLYDHTQSTAKDANSNKESNLKLHFRNLKQKACHLRDDIEDEIALRTSKAAKAQEKVKRIVKERIHNLKEASAQLTNPIDRFAKRSKFGNEPIRNDSHRKSSKNRSESVNSQKGSSKENTRTTTSRPRKSSLSPTTASPDTEPVTIPIVGYGLGDGFGRHTR